MLNLFLFLFGYSLSITLKPYYNDYSIGKVYIKCELGTPSQVEYFVFDISTSISFVLDQSNFDNKQSNTFQVTDHYIKLDREIEGYSATDFLTIAQNASISSFKFIFVEQKIHSSYTSLLGFGIGPTSILSELKKGGIIKKKNFLISSSISIDVDEKMFKERVYILENEQSKYKLNLTNVIFNRKRDKKESSLFRKDASLKQVKLIFSTTREFIIFPMFLYEKFYQNYFEEVLEECECTVVQKYYLKYFECEGKNIEKLPNIKMRLGEEHILELTPFDLFESQKESSEKLRFLIEFSDDFVDVLMGYRILRKLETLFNEEEKFISFGKKDKFYHIKKEIPKVEKLLGKMRVILLCIILILSVGSAINIYWNLKN